MFRGFSTDRNKNINSTSPSFENPYQSPSSPGGTQREESKPRPWYLKFRWHFIAAPLVGILIAGNPHEVSNPIDWVLYVPLLSLLMSWGVWHPPLNYLLVFCIFAAVAGFQLAKRLNPIAAPSWVIRQAGFWWFLWLLFGMAERFGVYRGP